jgi:DNA-directed RNA polymerase subunit RPC12/RpoP
LSSNTTPARGRLFHEFRCPGCGPQVAFRSRPRGFFENHVLPFLLLQAVRCERCYHRRYVLRTVPVLERELGADSPIPAQGGATRDRDVA